MNDALLIEYARAYYIGSKTEYSFKRDFYLLKLINKQLIRYRKKNVLNYRLLLNNVILFFNVFQTQQGKTILFHFIDPQFHSIMKTILFHLNLLQDDELNHIALDQHVSIILEEMLH